MAQTRAESRRQERKRRYDKLTGGRRIVQFGNLRTMSAAKIAMIASLGVESGKRYIYDPQPKKPRQRILSAKA